jgi:hypothetical protein
VYGSVGIALLQGSQVSPARPCTNTIKIEKCVLSLCYSCLLAGCIMTCKCSYGARFVETRNI